MSCIAKVACRYASSEWCALACAIARAYQLADFLRVILLQCILACLRSRAESFARRVVGLLVLLHARIACQCPLPG
eukprot:15445234-Alexandrium_andersonii.AAC.1